MKKNESIKNVLTREVISVHTGQKLSDASKIFRENPIHHLPVLDNRKPVGIISTNDIYKLVFDVERTDQRMADALLDHQFTIESVMMKSVKTLPDTAVVRDAAEILQDSAIHSVLIVDGSGDLAGIVTSTDLIKYLLDQF